MDTYHSTRTGGNNYINLGVDRNGILWCCSQTDGIFRFDGEKWTNYNKKNKGFVNNHFTAVAFDDFGNKWFGSWGGGVVQIDNNDNITVYGSDYLSGSVGSPNYIPVTNIAVDNLNNVWCTIYNAGNGNVVSVRTPENEWYHFSTDDGIRTNPANEIYGLTIDQYGNAWVGSVAGVTRIVHNNTLADKSDDDLSGTLTTADGLKSNDVRYLAEDLDGVMWFGTDKALNFGRWENNQLNIYEEENVIDNNIEAIAVDIRNNKWFGTSKGFSVLAPDNFTWKHYTVDEYPLVNENVTSFAFDGNTGKAYIGTTNGLSSLETPYAKPELNLDKVKAGPNPFIINKNKEFILYKLAENVSINFLTINGMAVHKVSKDDIQGIYAWDGRNDDGALVASGIYLYIIYNEDTGDSKVGKVAVIK